jgi:hypothetical protein
MEWQGNPSVGAYLDGVPRARSPASEAILAACRGMEPDARRLCAQVASCGRARYGRAAVAIRKYGKMTGFPVFMAETLSNLILPT